MTTTTTTTPEAASGETDMGTIDGLSTEDREAASSSDRSIRPVIEHALTVYYDGNAELARTLIDRLISEGEGQ